VKSKPEGMLNISYTGNILSSLKNRGVISVRGPHATDLLQNVMS
jgi:folate-binding Fe-S cluster repair protein YgfZ